jgi:hypothetical protein
MSFFDKNLQEDLAGFAILNLKNAGATGEGGESGSSYKLVEYVYPALSKELEAVIVSAAASAAVSEPSYGVYSGTWYYCWPSSEGLPGGDDKPSTKNSSCVGTVVLSKSSCHPPKFLALAEALSAVYRATASPPQVLEAWLQAFLKNRIPALPAINLKGWKASDFDASALVQPSASAPLKSLLSAISVEAVLVWSALLLKKRVAVYGSNRAAVAEAVTALSLLVSHRAEVKTDRTGVTSGNDAVVSVTSGCPIYPHVVLRYPPPSAEGNEAAYPDLHHHSKSDVQTGITLQLQELVGRAATVNDDGTVEPVGAAAGSYKPRKRHYIAGFTDPIIASNNVTSFLPSEAPPATSASLWDVCVDLDGGSVAVADDASGE